jgi:hypothetical protein
MSQANITNVKPRATVVNRTLIWQGAVVNYKVPVTAMLNEFKNPSLTLRYLSTMHGVRHGGVYVHVHMPEGEELRGKDIVAAASVWRKTLTDGAEYRREYLHIDLRPTQAEVTHRFFVVPLTDGLELPKEEGWIRFDLPKPLEGVIAFGKPDAVMPNLKPRRRLTVEDLWIGGVPAAYAENGTSDKKERASPAQIGELAAKFKKP